MEAPMEFLRGNLVQSEGSQHGRRDTRTKQQVKNNDRGSVYRKQRHDPYRCLAECEMLRLVRSSYRRMMTHMTSCEKAAGPVEQVPMVCIFKAVGPQQPSGEGRRPDLGLFC